MIETLLADYLVWVFASLTLSFISFQIWLFKKYSKLEAKKIDKEELKEVESTQEDIITNQDNIVNFLFGREMDEYDDGFIQKSRKERKDIQKELQELKRMLHRIDAKVSSEGEFADNLDTFDRDDREDSD